MKRASSALGHENLIGSVLLGRYRVVRELAKGGMGVVYLARAEGAVGFVKPVVIKLVLPEHASDERFLSMFVREAQILAHLRHPSVVDVLEFGEQDGAYVMVLEYVRGYHLGQWSRYLQPKQRKIPIEILLQIVIDVLDALHHAHNAAHPDGTSMRIVHRDVSPSNILLDEDGRARLLDFGVARMRSAADDQTQFKGFVGKLTYTAPELFRHEEASPRSDLYSCAVVLHEAILGRNVFRADNQAASMHRVMNHAPESLESARDDLPDDLDPVLQKALAKDPEQRFESAREFASALRKLQPEPESEARARLAALLHDDFGSEMAQLLGLESLADRDDAWRRLSVRPRSPTDADDARESVSQVRVGARPAPAAGGIAAPPPIGATLPIPSMKRATRSQQIEVPPALVTPPAADVPAAPPVPVAPSVPVAPQVPVASPAPPAAPPATSQRGLILSIALVGCLAAAAIVLSLVNRVAPPPPAAAQFRVVSQQVPSPPADAPPAAPVPAPAAPEPAAVPTSAPAKEPARAAKRSGPDAQGLTRAFRNQQPKIQACFAAHAIGLQGHPQMQVDFDLDARGKLSNVAVTPAALAKTALGACIEHVARATAFPAQGERVSFSIPVTASRTEPGR